MKYFVFIIPFLLVYSVSAQTKLNPVDPLKKYQEASALYHSEDYNDAISLLEKINENDSIFADAARLYGNILLAQEKFDNVILHCDTLLDHYNINRESLFITKGLAELRKDDYEAAIATFQTALGEYPMSYLLYFNMAVTLENMEKWPEAIDAFKKCILLNPYYASPHLHLGNIAYREQRITQAVLAWDMYLLLAPTRENSLNVLIKLNDAVSQKNTEEALGIKISEDDDAFSEIDLIVSNFAALDKGFKVPNPISIPAVKQNYAIFSKLKDVEGSNDFWEAKYVQFFEELFKDGYFDHFVYRIMLTSNSKKHQKLIKKNSRYQDDFLAWAGNTLTKIIGSNNSPFWGEPVERFWYGSEGMLSSIGAVDENGDSQGKYLFYYESGRLLSEGFFKDDERSGHWIWHTPKGIQDSEGYYTEGNFEGSYIDYYDSGKIRETTEYKEGKYHGKIKSYTHFGALSSEATYNMGSADGITMTYHEIGENYPEYRIKYKDGEVIDTVYRYYDTGELEMELIFENNERSSEIIFFKNGDTSYVYQYSEGKLNGHYLSKYRNGKIHSEGQYSNDNQSGTWLRYYDTGILSEETNYDEEGRKEGISREYTRLGNLHAESLYSKDKLIAYKYFDDEGNILADAEKQNRQFDYKGYYSNGTLRAEGIYRVDGSKEGVWKYYSLYGALESTETYEDGIRTLGHEKFYVNGFLESRFEYSNDMANGFYESYYINGQLKQQGYFKNDNKTGVWLSYYPDGKLKKKEYYKDDIGKGYFYYYAAEGSLSTKAFVKDNYRLFELNYNPSGEITDTVNYITDKVLEESYTDGKTKLTQELVYGYPHGTHKTFHPNGRIKSEGEIFMAEYSGDWKWYNDDGVLVREASYKEGEYHGKQIKYHTNGEIAEIENYELGEMQGISFNLSENGDTLYKANYISNLQHGPQYWYSGSGELQLVRYYHFGELTGYSYAGPRRETCGNHPS